MRHCKDVFLVCCIHAAFGSASSSSTHPPSSYFSSCSAGFSASVQLVSPLNELLQPRTDGAMKNASATSTQPCSTSRVESLVGVGVIAPPHGQQSSFGAVAGPRDAGREINVDDGSSIDEK